MKLTVYFVVVLAMEDLHVFQLLKSNSLLITVMQLFIGILLTLELEVMLRLQLKQLQGESALN